jgi:hypothetical protein
MRRKHRQTYFICSVIKDNRLISIPIEAETEEIASVVFKQQIGIVPEIILGAFYKKKRSKKELKPRLEKPKLEKRKGIKRSGLRLKPLNGNRGTYDGWDITYIPTNDDNKVFVFYNKRLDNIKIPKPRNNIVNVKDIIIK